MASAIRYYLGYGNGSYESYKKYSRLQRYLEMKKLHRSAKKLQYWWINIYYNPENRFCQNRLLKKYESSEC